MSHIKRQENIVAYCLSRPANAIRINLCDLQEIMKKQNIDKGIKILKS